ncbi:MAG: hypothetical protein M3Q48_07785, partial [Actinomycetota bacterium]|nr:hypothetical protein [Actinomycetota bacterium]
PPEATPAPAAAAAAPGKGAGKGEGGDEGQETADEEVCEGTSGAGGTAPAAAGGRSEEEPINRGMLLKFLSSVRS